MQKFETCLTETSGNESMGHFSGYVMSQKIVPVDVASGIASIVIDDN